MRKGCRLKLNAIVLPNGSLELEWEPTEETPDKSRKLFEEELYRRCESDFNSFLLFLAFSDKEIPLTTSLDFWRDFFGLFAKKIIHTEDIDQLRHKIKIPLDEEEIFETLIRVPLITGAEYINKELLGNLWLRLKQEFIREIQSYDGTVEEFIKAFSPHVHLVGRVYFHLVESKNEDHPFAFLATYSTRLNKQGKSKHLPLRGALKEYGKNSKKLLALLTTVHMAAANSSIIADLLESGELFHPLAWSAKEAFAFLRETPIYDKAGILCRIPDWWKGNRSTLKVNVSIGEKNPSLLGMDALLSFNATLSLGGVSISFKEAQKLLKEAEGLSFIKNRWIPLDHKKLEQSLEAYEKAKSMMSEEGLSLRDALRLQLNPKGAFNLGEDEEEIEISNGKWMESVIRKLRDPGLIDTVKPPKGFRAELREYQQKGLDWLHLLHSLQFGACLADDMGLGKTVQILAFLNVLKKKSIKKASLLIIPASLISNWTNEIDNFSPEIKYHVAHPSANKDKKVAVNEKKSLDTFDLVITTYALSQRYEWIQDYSWRYLILDEAQAIKNPGAKQTKAVKKISAFNRIVMTGTPIENRLSDLWSLFDFLNPGLLGNAKEFTGFTKNLKQDPNGYSRLRNVISPYILRRLKTDKSIISDLPDKVEMKTYATLSKKQVILYKNIVEKLKATILDTDGIKRKGMILASLMKFKQICNHPDQYTGTGEFNESDSGKFGRLKEICETIYEKREKVLIFTQFKELAAPLGDYLETIFGRAGLILHGSVPVAKRKKIIERFQNHEYVPYMVLSLKAGGVGLNLTEANHVIHFDRWWNPAVENQATDRVFRIGQKKNVVVHKFITKGTIEEKIDVMLEAKSQMSKDVIQSSGESLITEMDNKQLMDLLKLTI